MSGPASSWPTIGDAAAQTEGELLLKRAELCQLRSILHYGQVPGGLDRAQRDELQQMIGLYDAGLWQVLFTSEDADSWRGTGLRPRIAAELERRGISPDAITDEPLSHRELQVLTALDTRVNADMSTGALAEGEHYEELQQVLRARDRAASAPASDDRPHEERGLT